MIFGTEFYIDGASCLKCGARMRITERRNVIINRLSSYRVECVECWWNYHVEAPTVASEDVIHSGALERWAMLKLREL